MFLKRQGKPGQFIYVAQLHTTQSFTKKMNKYNKVMDKSKIKIKININLNIYFEKGESVCLSDIIFSLLTRPY